MYEKAINLNYVCVIKDIFSYISFCTDRLQRLGSGSCNSFMFFYNSIEIYMETSTIRDIVICFIISVDITFYDRFD